MSLLSWVVAVALLCVVWQLLRRVFSKRLVNFDAENRPYPPLVSGYLIGNIDTILRYIWQTLKHDELQQVMREVKAVGRTVRYGTLFDEHQLILTVEPDCVGHFLAKNFENYNKGDNFLEIFDEFLGEGIFNTNGELWKSQRDIARPHFSKMEFGQMADVFNRHASTVLNILDNARKSGQYIDIQEVFPRYTIDTFGEHFFGHEIGSLLKPSQFAKDFKYAQNVVSWRYRLHPAWRIWPKSQFIAALKRMDQFVYSIIDEALDDKNIEHRQDLLAHFIKYGQQNSMDFSRKYLRDMLLNFLLAGRDTTAALLGWVFYCLNENPDVEARLIREVDDVLQGELPNESNVKELKYLAQVLKETLRLYPSVPFDVRAAVKDDVLPNGYAILAGTEIAYSSWMQHRLPELFGDDAEVFDPDRWGPERVHSIRPFYFVPFHAGPRICLGQHMALLEASVMTVRILQTYRLRLKPKHPVKLNADVILTSAYGLPMSVNLRSDIPA